MENTIPEYWKTFVIENQLLGKEIDIPENKDLSEVSATFEIMSFKDSIEEMTKFYPGLAVAKDNYIPIGSCCIGSGDPYFINTNDGNNGKLYRIYHDEVFDENYNPKNAIAIVLENYEDILKYID